MTGRRLHHPGRDYLLSAGPLEAAMDLGHWPSQDWFVPQSPSLIWPKDNSWCVATEVDAAHLAGLVTAAPGQLDGGGLAEPDLGSR